MMMVVGWGVVLVWISMLTTVDFAGLCGLVCQSRCVDGD
jgi:hypothetical protein